MEGYGKVVLFLKTVLSRFQVKHQPLFVPFQHSHSAATQLYSDLPRHLGANTGFFVHWLPSAPAVYPLQGLDDESKSAIDGWVEGLFGEGISDDLMQ